MSQKNKNLYLHIGMPKNASTYLQKNIFNYFSFYLGKDNFYDDGIYQNKLFNDILFDNAINYFNLNNDNLILSDERFFFSPPDRVFSKKKYLKLISFFKSENYNINIILFIRRQDSFAKSLYLQSLRHGNTMSLKNFYRNIIYDQKKSIFYIDKIKYLPLKNTFNYSYFINFINNNSDSLTIIPFEEFKENPNVIKKINLFKNLKLIKNNKKSNVSNGFYNHLLKRFFNRFFYNSYHPKLKIKGYIPYIKNKKLKFTKFRNILVKFNLIDYWNNIVNFLDKPYKDKTGTCKKILEMCKEDNKKLDKKYKLGLKKYGYY